MFGGAQRVQHQQQQQIYSQQTQANHQQPQYAQAQQFPYTPSAGMSQQFDTNGWNGQNAQNQFSQMNTASYVNDVGSYSMSSGTPQNDGMSSDQFLVDQSSPFTPANFGSTPQNGEWGQQYVTQDNGQNAGAENFTWADQGGNMDGMLTEDPLVELERM